MLKISQKHIEDFRWMIDNKFVPYQNQKIPEIPGKTFEEIRELGKHFFPHSEHSFEMAMAVYDWTTADFARMQFLNLFTYGEIFISESHIFDFDNIANAIYTSRWGTYRPSDVYYMNSFMMKPTCSLQNIKEQLSQKLAILDEKNIAECAILCEAVLSLPKVKCSEIPKLYSGQVDFSNLGSQKFASYFVELPANNDNTHPPIEMDLEETLSSFLNVGNTVTLKTFMSFADTYDIAKQYSNGIVLTVLSPEKSLHWENMAFITPISNDPKKNEYLFLPSTKFKVESISRNIDVIEIQLRIV